MRLIFFGTSSFAARILEFLLKEKAEVAAVVTRPDRQRGRSLHFLPPPVKEALCKIHSTIPIHQPEKASTAEFAETLRSYHADLFVVVAYGEILKQMVLDIPKKGCINIHASLLPKYRGASPIQRCLMDGAKESGITIMEMVLKMDAGDMLEVAKVTIPPEMTFGELEEKLCGLACHTLAKILKDIERGSIKKVAQDHALATFAPKLTPQEEEIHWQRPASELHNLIRALSPYPGAWCKVKIGNEEKRLKIKLTQVVDRSGEPGSILSSGKDLVVACGEQALKLIEVQLEGKKNLPAEEFLRGLNHPLAFLT